MADMTLKRNDLLPLVSSVVQDQVGPVDLVGATALFRMVNVLDGSTKINTSAEITVNPTFSASGATLTANGHGLNNDAPVTLKTSGTLPTGLLSSVRYFVRNATANTLQLSLTEGGAVITTTGAGTGTHTLITGKVGYTWQAGDTDRAGTFLAEIQATSGGLPLTFPNTGHLLVEVISDLV